MQTFHKSYDARFRPIRKYTAFTEGCTDSSACNFDSSATDDDGSCEYAVENFDCDEEQFAIYPKWLQDAKSSVIKKLIKAEQELGESK